VKKVEKVQPLSPKKAKTFTNSRPLYKSFFICFATIKKFCPFMLIFHFQNNCMPCNHFYEILTPMHPNRLNSKETLFINMSSMVGVIKV
jgi:hypothetical protein